MQRTLILAAALLLVAGCKKNGSHPRTTERQTPATQKAPASAAQSAPMPSTQEALTQAAKAPNAQRIHVINPRGSGDIVLQMERPGNGPSPKASDSVTVNYRGTLLNGHEFDSSYERHQPATFPVRGVVPCWTTALQHMKVHEKAKVTCSPSTAYGARGMPPVIPPDSTLVFEIELLSIGH